MFEAFRVNTPLTTGIVQWMLNSAWPAIYWQLYDYYGAPVAAYYGTKKACEPVQLIYNYKDSHVYLVNEGLFAGDVVANVKVYDDASALLCEETKTVATSYRNTADVFDLGKFDGKPHFVALEIKDAEGNFVADNFYCIAAQRNVYDFEESTWYDSPITSYSDLRFAFAQPKAQISMQVTYADGVYTVAVTNNSEYISYMNILKAKDAEGNLVTPAYWSDNFFPLLPGQTKTVTCKVAKKGLTVELNA
jgi:exo-1,4-beta-D-glucosaminidase